MSDLLCQKCTGAKYTMPPSATKINVLSHRPNLYIFGDDLIHVDGLGFCSICGGSLNHTLCLYNQEYYLCRGVSFIKLAPKKIILPRGYTFNVSCKFISIPELGNTILCGDSTRTNLFKLIYFENLKISRKSWGDLFELDDVTIFGTFCNSFQGAEELLIISTEGNIIQYKSIPHTSDVLNGHCFANQTMEITVTEFGTAKFKPINSGLKTKPALRSID